MFSVISLVIVSTGPFLAISVSWSTAEGNKLSCSWPSSVALWELIGKIGPTWVLDLYQTPGLQGARCLITHSSLIGLSQLWFTFLLLWHPSEYVDVFLLSCEESLPFLEQLIHRLQLEMSFSKCFSFRSHVEQWNSSQHVEYF